MTVSSAPTRLRLCGTIAGPEGAIPIADATMVVSGAVETLVETREPFELILDDHQRVRVELPAGDALRVLATKRTARGRWADIETNPLARVFREQAPGPHVAVKLSGRLAAVGDSVEILADVLEHEPTDGPSGPRDAPAMRVAAVRATIIAWGRDTATEMDALCREALPALSRDVPRPASTPRAWKRWALITSIVAGLGVIAVAMLSSRVVLVDVVSVVAALVAASYEVVNPGTEVPVFRAGADRRNDPERVGLPMLAGLSFAGAAVVSLLHIVGALAGDAPDPTYVVPLLSAATLVVSATSLLLACRYAVRVVTLLLGAAPHPRELPDGAWGMSVGVVRDPTPLLTTAAPLAMALTVGDAKKLAHEGTFFVETEAGPIEIDPEGALWASRVTAARVEGEERVYQEIVPIGASVAVVGRLRRRGEEGARLASTGPESLILFATAADESALELLRRFVRSRRNMLALLLGTAAAILAFAAGVLGRV